MKKLITLLTLLPFLLNASLEKTHYPLTSEPIDVIIPCHHKDIPILNLCIDGIRENGESIGRIIVVSSHPYTDQAEWFDEAQFPFTKLDVASRLMGKPQLAEFYLNLETSKAGWIYQQLLKLYAPFIIPDLSSNVLVLDADTVFLHPVSFLDEEGNGLYNPSHNECFAYHNHMHKLLPEINALPKLSGVCHHMLLQRAVLEDLFSLVETAHQKPFWHAFIDSSKPKHGFNICAPSEYEIYFHFVFNRTDQAKIRKLKWRDLSQLCRIEECRLKGYHFVSLHSYNREL